MSIKQILSLICLDIIYSAIVLNMSSDYHSGTKSIISIIVLVILFVSIIVMPSWIAITGIGNRINDDNKKKEHLEKMGLETQIENMQVVEINIQDIYSYITTNIITIILFISNII